MLVLNEKFGGSAVTQWVICLPQKRTQRVATYRDKSLNLVKPATVAVLLLFLKT